MQTAVTDLLYGPGQPMPGSTMTDDEALDYARKNYPEGNYCLVREWILIDLVVSEEQLALFTTSKLEPAIIYAHSVVFDNQRRWDVGDFVRTSPLHEFKEGFQFSTRHSTYLLLGPGTRKRASIDTIAAFMK